ncbi:FAD linked oxidase domain protein [Thermaerobacter marianensis DSM 12885]|uniref:FAD linked oxidase domain protein n=1 Tax=Thermaerobacter marianensis (strain ATCC 700841 / DSM 12885 / JCM 10246 / 7p75a) TaxID=644966 RepID=E6SHY8_THEM7|nr:FAD-binding oxidoreductase [Thermaerobacter marianensis]ADU51868.1 FAD linked oxidase domain protein [Thermaerobacter marianensis DSM 12885]
MDDEGSLVTEPVALPEPLLKELCDLVGTHHVSVDPHDLEWAAMDFTGGYRLGRTGRSARRPLAVVRPGDVEDVRQLVLWAARHRIPLVPRGGGTGVMGSAVPQHPAVVVDLTRLDDIVVHPDDLLAEAGAGATLAAVDAALRRHGLALAHDPWSVGIATVGGAIGTDGVGYLAGRWGSMGQQVVAIEAVLPDGQVVRTRPVPKPAAGPDLRALFAGSQGTLGIVTRAWIRAVGAPEVMLFRSYRFRGFEPGFEAVRALWRAGVIPDLLDFTDDVPAAVELEPGYEDDLGRTGLLHLGFFGVAEEARGRAAAADRIVKQFGARDLGDEPARAFWERRHEIAEQFALPILQARDARRRWQQGAFDYINLALPASQVIPYRREALARIAADPRFRAGETGLWGRPEVFSLLVSAAYPATAAAPAGTAARGSGGAGGPEEGCTAAGVAADEAGPWAAEWTPEDAAAMEALMHDLLRMAQARGGNMECLHGTGLKLLPLLQDEFGPALKVIREIKRALDPLDLMNPGKWGETTASPEPGAAPGTDGPERRDGVVIVHSRPGGDGGQGAVATRREDAPAGDAGDPGRRGVASQGDPAIATGTGGAGGRSGPGARVPQHHRGTLGDGSGGAAGPAPGSAGAGAAVGVPGDGRWRPGRPFHPGWFTRA